MHGEAVMLSVFTPKEGSHICHLCDFKGTKINLLKRHLRRMHGQSEIEKVFGEKPEWDCPHCEFKAHIKNEVKRHIAAEHGEKELRAYKLRYRQSTIYYFGLLGRWDKQIVDQESDVPSIIFLYFL